MPTAISSTRAIRRAMMELHDDLINNKVSNQSARVRINAARTILESIKVELAVEALGFNPRVVEWANEKRETDKQIDTPYIVKTTENK